MPRMRTRIHKWFRSVRPKSVKGVDSTTNDGPYGVRFEEECPSVTSGRCDSKSRRSGATKSSSQLVKDRPRMPYGRNGVRGLLNRSAPVVSEASQTLSRTTAPIRHPLDMPQGPLPNPLPASGQRNVSVGSSHPSTASSMPPYAMPTGSEESVTSMSVQSIASSPESMTFEESQMEQDASRTCGGVFLDPFSMMPPNIDHMLAFLAPGCQSQHMAGPMSQNANDIVAFLATDLDLGSLSEAWTRGLQTPVESSA